MVRHAAAHYQPITWPHAFAMIAEELNRLDSPDQACFYTSGKTTNEPAFLLQLFARQFGTNNLPDCSNMCHESSGVAMVGATTGIASLGWNIYSKITANRPKLVVKAYANMVQMPPPPKNPRFLRITVQNIGTAPTITNVEFYRVIPRWKRLLYRLHLKKRGEEIHAIINDYRGAQIPHELEVGSEWVTLMEQEGARIG
jgi:hypothetical protein